MEHNGLTLDNVWDVVPAMTVATPFSDGDGKWRLAGRGRPAGSGQDLLERRTGSVPIDAHWPQTEV